jgi:bis(5'-nucleosyl)-tetraphosphatase (symmetrical)
MNYIVGDIQGCFRGLKRLLKKIHFYPEYDTLWAVGDLVARGDDSLSTLAFLFDLGDNFKTVLGNHDLHLLSVINGVKDPKEADRLGPLLKSKDLPKFESWLRQFPLARLVDENTLMIHAGLFPKWSVTQALALSAEVEEVLQSKEYVQFLSTMYSSKPQHWETVAHSSERLVFIVNALTRMRFLTHQGFLDFKEKRGPEDAPSSLVPWFKCTNEALTQKQRIVFGHWASLAGNTKKKSMIGLDTGYVWGGYLSCWCLETDKITRISA